jgi:Tfp pilus assembly protein PilF
MTVVQEDNTRPELAALREVEAAISAQDFPRAFQIADAEISRGRVHPALYNARALSFERQQQDDKALVDFRRALLLAPKNVVLLNAVGLCLMRLVRLDEAVDCFDQAIRSNPVYVPSYVRKANALHAAGDLKGARAHYERTLKLDPQNAEAHARLASMAAFDGDAARARTLARRSLEFNPKEPTGLATLALVDVMEGNHAAAEERARSILRESGSTGINRARIFAVLGDALDGQDRVEEAFAAYSAENMELLRAHAVGFAGKLGIAEIATKIEAFVERSPELSWCGEGATAPREGAPTAHVFLLGFYRSGTTLLEQVLEAHPDIVTLEERDFLEDAAERYLTHNAGLHKLAVLDGDTLESMRAEYWRRVQEVGLTVQRKVFIDKHPLNTLKLPLISKLFPDAKIILALRDPRDVVLSCFRRHFQVNAAMYGLLTLQGAADSYVSVMHLARTMRERLSMPVLEHRYEDLIDDFEKAVRRVCNFIGVNYADGMANFNTVVRTHEIRSPSMHQVRRPLYGEAKYQWRRYARHLEPVMPALRPWIELFGYPAE